MIFPTKPRHVLSILVMQMSRVVQLQLEDIAFRLHRILCSKKCPCHLHFIKIKSPWHVTRQHVWAVSYLINLLCQTVSPGSSASHTCQCTQVTSGKRTGTAIYVLYSYLFFIKTKLKVLLKIVLMRSAVDRLKMKRLVTVRIFRWSGQRRWDVPDKV